MEPIHEAPLERQVALAAVEQRHIDAFEGGAPIPAKDLARALRTDGLAHVEDVLDGATASALLAHVNRRLDCALAASDDAATPQQRRAAIGGAVVGGAAGGGGEALLGAIMCRSRRYDLKLDLDEPAVAAALSQLLGALGRPLVSLLGRGAQLFELGALIADAGAPRQPLHPDTPFSARLRVATCTVALQDVAMTQGPTNYLPRTHTEPLDWGSDPTDDEDVAEQLASTPCRIPLPRRGDAVIFDSRCFHCGGAHTGGPRRVLFYCSFQARDAWRHAWRGCGFEQPGTLLDALRGRYCLDRAGRLVAVARSAGMAWLAAAAVAWLHAAVRWLAAVAVNDRVSRSYEYGFLFS